MAFVLPTFNMTCDIYTFPYNFAAAPRIAAQICQLRAPNATSPQMASGLLAFTNAMMLLLPPATDIRDIYCAPINSADAVVIPTGTTCRYQVMWVNDIGKGFPNEHRFAIIAKINTGPWPVPIP